MSNHIKIVPNEQPPTYDEAALAEHLARQVVLLNAILKSLDERITLLETP